MSSVSLSTLSNIIRQCNIIRDSLPQSGNPIVLREHIAGMNAQNFDILMRSIDQLCLEARELEYCLVHVVKDI